MIHIYRMVRTAKSDEPTNDIGINDGVSWQCCRKRQAQILKRIGFQGRFAVHAAVFEVKTSNNPINTSR